MGDAATDSIREISMRFHWLLLGLLTFTLVACGGDPYSSSGGGNQPAAGGGGGGGAVTGLLLNVQRPPDQTPFKSTLDEFTVADPLGNPIFSQADLPPPTSPVGAVWTWKRADAMSFSNRKPKLGDNFYEIRMTRDEFSEDFKKGTFYVSDATAAELRNMPNLKNLLKQAKLIVLVGKQGE
jgi:hypothetical protein